MSDETENAVHTENNMIMSFNFYPHTSSRLHNFTCISLKKKKKKVSDVILVASQFSSVKQVSVYGPRACTFQCCMEMTGTCTPEMSYRFPSSVLKSSTTLHTALLFSVHTGKDHSQRSTSAMCC